MLSHEVLEKAPAPFLMFRDFLPQFRRRSDYVAYCEGSRDRDLQVEPFDVAVKFPCEKEGGLQYRVREIMLFDRNENGLETHGRSPIRARVASLCAQVDDAGAAARDARRGPGQ